MGAKRGLNVIISVKEGSAFKALAGQRGANLNRSTETLDVSNKVTEGWKEYITGSKEWSIECDGILMADDTAFAKLEQFFLEGSEVDVKIGDNTGWGYEGKAIITDFPIEAPYDDALSYTLTLQGTGALNKISTLSEKSK